MPTFKGFNTINRHHKFGMTDFDLIKRDLLNSFLIREGTVPGRPDLGTKIWNFIFDQNDDTTRNAIDNEVRRIIKLDIRLRLESVNLSYNHNTVIVEVAVSALPNVAPETFALVFDKDSESLYIS